MTWQARAIGVMVDGAAEGITTARSINTARVLTDAINAGFIGRTPFIGPATIDTLVALTHVSKGTVSVRVTFFQGLHWNLPAFNLWITDESSLAGTDWPMSSNDTECIDAAGSGNVAEVLALAVVARLSG